MNLLDPASLSEDDHQQLGFNSYFEPPRTGIELLDIAESWYISGRTAHDLQRCLSNAVSEGWLNLQLDGARLTLDVIGPVPGLNEYF